MHVIEITEAAENATLFYHGTPIRFDHFESSFVGQGHDQEGPGFYFSTSKKTAAMHASGPNGHILVVNLHPRKLVPLQGRVNINHVSALMKASPRLQDALQDWDENPNVAFRMALQGMVVQGEPKESFERVWYDFYRNDPQAWLQGMIKLGYDGIMVPQRDGSIHAVIFDPKRITVLDRISPITESDAEPEQQIATWEHMWPKAGQAVSGLKVMSDVPNTSSISASLGDDYYIVHGIRELPMTMFGGPRTFFYAKDDFERAAMLAQQIKHNQWINPVIIVVDNEGPYVLEGAHRMVALQELNIKSVPAMVVLDTNALNLTN